MCFTGQAAAAAALDWLMQQVFDWDKAEGAYMEYVVRNFRLL